MGTYGKQGILERTSCTQPDEGQPTPKYIDVQRAEFFSNTPCTAPVGIGTCRHKRKRSSTNTPQENQIAEMQWQIEIRKKKIDVFDCPNSEPSGISISRCGQTADGKFGGVYRQCCDTTVPTLSRAFTMLPNTGLQRLRRENGQVPWPCVSPTAHRCRIGPGPHRTLSGNAQERHNDGLRVPGTLRVPGCGRNALGP